MSEKKVDTTPPSGLSIHRSGYNFTFEWKIADKDYGAGQEFYWVLNGVQQGKKQSIGKTTTSKTVLVNVYSTVVQIGFAVRGQRKKYEVTKKKKKIKCNPTWSKWSPYVIAIGVPNATQPTYALDTSHDYSGTFSGNIDLSVDEFRPFWRWEWQSVLVKDWNSADIYTGWSSAGSADGQMFTGSGSETSYSFPHPEESEMFGDRNASYTRFFRAKTVGCAGETGWLYARHTYARPRQAILLDAEVTQTANSGFTCSVRWNAPESYSHPIDEDIVSYAFVKPRFETTREPSEFRRTRDTAIESGKTYYYRKQITVRRRDPHDKRRMRTKTTWSYEKVETPVLADISKYYDVVGYKYSTVPKPDASSPSWTQARVIKDTSGEDALSFDIPQLLDYDECIFVKVDTKYDGYTTPGEPEFATNGFGKLAVPKVRSIAPNPSTHRVNVSATNNSDIDSSFLVIYFRYEDTPDVYQPIGIMKKNESAVTVQCPDWGSKGFSIGVQALVADYSPAEPSATEVTNYTISNIFMSSEIVWDEGRLPMPPIVYDLEGRTDPIGIRVRWDWTWTDANKAEISWADHEDAWESTDGPQTYEVTDINAAAWNIAGLSVGTWWVKVRLIQEQGDTVLYGLYSEPRSIKLSSTPAIPSLHLSEGVVTKDSDVECDWAFTCSDGTTQMQADIREMIYDSTKQTYSEGDIVATAYTSQHATIHLSDLNWNPGETHYLAVKVMSTAGENSDDWSKPVPLKIAEELTVEVSDVSLVEESFSVGDEGDVYTVDSLKTLPLSFTVDTKGMAKSISASIVRAKEFNLIRPDNSTFGGFVGEIIASKEFTGDGNYEIVREDITGYLDDDAGYKLIVVAKDEYGRTVQSATIEQDDTRGYFEVHWEHQAIIPSAEVEINTEHNAAILTPKLPAELPDGYVVEDGDVCDIYRLSVDAPELIYENAAWGEKYVDPYPTLGEFGGHRFVYKTANGDYITEDNVIAFHDTTDDDSDILDVFSVLIDFEGEQISLPYNVSLSNRWAKDFQQTNYLGGSIQGDWNPAVTRTGSVSTVGIVDIDEREDGTIEAMRRLANYSGICHVRTPDGSSYSANINVSEDREEKMVSKLAKYSLEITKVDGQILDGMTYEEWLRTIHEGE